jgi:hypothetical protein
MSEKIQLPDTFDPNSKIENITLSATYIFALEELLMHYIMRMENPDQVRDMYKKFEDYIKGEIDIDKNPFTKEERNLYTIYSLQQLFRAKAYEQGLNVKIKGTVSKETLAELMQATLDNDVESLKEINKKIKEEMSESS